MNEQVDLAVIILEIVHLVSRRACRRARPDSFRKLPVAPQATRIGLDHTAFLTINQARTCLIILKTQILPHCAVVLLKSVDNSDR